MRRCIRYGYLHIKASVVQTDTQLAVLTVSDRLRYSSKGLDETSDKVGGTCCHTSRDVTDLG